MAANWRITQRVTPSSLWVEVHWDIKRKNWAFYCAVEIRSIGILATNCLRGGPEV